MAITKNTPDQHMKFFQGYLGNLTETDWGRSALCCWFDHILCVALVSLILILTAFLATVKTNAPADLPFFGGTF